MGGGFFYVDSVVLKLSPSFRSLKSDFLKPQKFFTLASLYMVFLRTGGVAVRRSRSFLIF